MPTWLKNFWHTRRLWALLAIAVMVVAVGAVLFWPVADLIAAHDVGQITGAQRAAHLQTARDAARGRLLQLGAGLFAAAALVYTARNFTLSRTGQVTDRYTKAVEQLGSEKLDVRIGAIYALERVARDSAMDQPTVMEVLAAFIREHSREQWPTPEPDTDVPPAPVPEPERRTRPDTQAALTVIGRRDTTHDGVRFVDLNDAVLIRANLRVVDLSHVTLLRADLTSASLLGANLTGTLLNDATVYGARFTDADLTGALFPWGALIPEGWVRDADSRRLKRANGDPSEDGPGGDHPGDDSPA